MLKDQRSTPDIANWNRRTLSPQLSKKIGIGFECPFIRKKDVDIRLGQEPPQHCFIFSHAAAKAESSLELGDDDKWKKYLMRRGYQLDQLDVFSRGEIAIPIGIDRKPHCQISGSICR